MQSFSPEFYAVPQNRFCYGPYPYAGMNYPYQSGWPLDTLAMNQNRVHGGLQQLSYQQPPQQIPQQSSQHSPQASPQRFPEPDPLASYQHEYASANRMAMPSSLAKVTGAPRYEPPSNPQHRRPLSYDAPPMEQLASQQSMFCGMSDIPPPLAGEMVEPTQYQPYDDVPQPHGDRGSDPATIQQLREESQALRRESWVISDEERFLVSLKDEEGLPWKYIQQLLCKLDFGDFRLPALQMRYKRLKEKIKYARDPLRCHQNPNNDADRKEWDPAPERMVELDTKENISGDLRKKNRYEPLSVKRSRPTKSKKKVFGPRSKLAFPLDSTIVSKIMARNLSTMR